ncbi:PRC-barrel domain-containing protein [Bradyrhizobium sp. CCBAU 53338]|uniref:PRC-barrel domain-containing protein n=1 Tax=Bradyrhizobium sp. CCBAU 53338 TaxID=1325111 RepID=UPI00188B706E|nr:PRC-barrel domain-containing protein [Bradyrhizobium sp. CCBAU 53338]QOZ54847.1 PRC-barrel domain containing protein [Bradyrhizobium sp. CCBAU 53338]
MRVAILLATTATIALGSAAWAASNKDNTPQASDIRQDVTKTLQKSGYRDISLAPTSFDVKAVDSDGNPVRMSIGPDSFAEMITVSDSHPSATDQNASAARPGNAGDYVTVQKSDDIASKLIGLDVYNNDNKDIGTIKDIALDQSGHANAYILSVGGFLGLGEHYVAVAPSAIHVTYNDNKWHAGMSATADQLKSAPEFKYSGRWGGSVT